MNPTLAHLAQRSDRSIGHGGVSCRRRQHADHCMARARDLKKEGTLGRATVLAPCFLLFLVFATTCAVALDPTQPAAGYLSRGFTVEDGLPSNVINAILQTQNGFLWIGTDAGLARFNGRHFTMIDFRGPRSAASGVVRALAEGPDGGLWVGTDFGLVHVPSTAPDESNDSPSMFYHQEGKRDEITNLKFSRDGSLWVGTNDGLFRFDRGRFVFVLAGNITQIEEAPDGHLLVVADWKFVELDGARVVEHPGLNIQLAIRDGEFIHVVRDRTGTTWFCTREGVVRLSGSSVYRYRPYSLTNKGAISLIEDRQGNVWMFTRAGLFRCTPTGFEPLALGVSVRYLFSDRDGNLWAGTNGDGLVQFKDRPIRMFTTADGLPNNIPMTVLARHDGSLWVGNNCGGLSRFDGQHFRTYNEKSGLLNSCVWALAEDSNNDLWIGTWGGGLFRFQQGQFTHYSKAEGLPGDVVRSIVAAMDGSLWIATDDGLSHRVNGRFRNYSTTDGLPSNSVEAVYQDRHSVIWAGTSRGIARMTGDRFAPLASSQEIFAPRYISLEEGPSGDLYAFSAPKGLSRVEGNQLVGVNSDLDVMSFADYEHRDLWFSSGNGIFRLAVSSVSPTAQDSGAPLDYLSIGRADGLNSNQCSVGAPNIAITRDGRLWVATVQGLAMIDLPRLPRTNRKPAIFMEDVTLGQKKQPIHHELVLPAGTNHLELKFDSIEFTSPEKIRFQYRLDGVDGSWLDADTTRTAVYNSIPIGPHSFHIRACNRDGVWDRAGTVFNVRQLPYYYETNWFRLLALLLLASLVTAIYFLRLHQIAQQFSRVLEARVGERTRIARELHDTLLQSFQGLTLHFQRARNLLPDRAPEAIQTLDRALDGAEQAIIEGRDAIHDLRNPGSAAKVLEEEITAFGEDLVAKDNAEKDPVRFRTVVEGSARPMRPNAYIDIFRIAREALRNAFSHSQGNLIETELAYTEGLFRLRVRDNGKGIDPDERVRGERSGHWGLKGMRERAERLGGELEVWSEPGAGTEIELRVPASIAYKAAPSQSSAWLFWRRKRNH
jgi:ligand-binding sensor domain-containing protein/signal transduction histidine kinase